MKRIAILAAVAGLVTAPSARATEQPVPPYPVSDANAGTTPVQGDGLYKALHEKAGIERIIEDMLARCRSDARISDIFKAADFERLTRTLTEQVCYISGGPCHYTGRDMKAAHADMGLQTADFDALVENLQLAMNKEGVAFPAQNRLLAKLAPMRAKVVTR